MTKLPRLQRCLLVIPLSVLLPSLLQAADWPQWLGPQRDGVWRETGILEKFPEGGPKVRWRVEIGPGYTGPAVAGGRVYVMDRQRAKDDKGENLPPKNGAILGKERVLCFDATKGKLLWKHEYDCPYQKVDYPAGPRTTPIIEKDKVYTLGTMGHIHCLNAEDGKVLWSKDLTAEYKVDPPVWGWSAHPLIEGDKLITLVGGEGSAVVAWDKNTGKELWRALTVQEIGYVPPMVFEAGGKRQLIVWHSEAVNSLDPETGKVYWSEKHPPHNKLVRPALPIATPRLLGDLLFVTNFHHGPLMLRLAADKPAATVLWRGKSDNGGRPDGLHSLISTPVLKDGHIYGIAGMGELRCFKAETNEQLWESLQHFDGKKGLFATAFLIVNEDRFFVFTDQGDLILAKVTPKGYEEISRAHILDPVQVARGRNVVWSHPAFAERCMFARNDKELVCVPLARDWAK